MNDNPKRKPGSLLKRALFNQYNYILLGSTGAVLDHDRLVAARGDRRRGVEMLWLVLGADTEGVPPLGRQAGVGRGQAAAARGDLGAAARRSTSITPSASRR